MRKTRYWLLIISIVVAGGGVVALRFSPIAGLLLILISGVALGLFVSRRGAPRQSSSSSNDLPATAATSRLMNNVFEVAFDEMREALVVVDEQLRVIGANRAARALFPHLREDDAPRLTEITRETAIYKAFADGIEGRQQNPVKIEFYREGLKSFDLRVVPLPANGKSSAGAVGILFDVTQLDRLENVRQEFLSNVSHELRTPLTSIMALAETLAAGAVDDTENNRRFLEMIQKNSQRMQHLLNDILELSTIESGNVNVQSESVPLASVVEDVVNSLSAVAADRNVSLRNNVDVRVRVFADPRRLVQMLTNLIDNAIKFNREDGTVTITHDVAGERNRIYVSDTGEGIPAQHLARIFERFYRVDRARTRNLGGTGLGLAIVKHLAKAHGGEILVNSRPGEGSEFVIDLPRENGTIQR